MLSNIHILKKQIIEAGKRMYNRGYVASNDGNISARADQNSIVITPSGVSKGFMRINDLVQVNLEGKILSGYGKPSSELHMHLQIYKKRSDVNSVCHAHPPYATGYAAAGIALDQCILSEVILTLGKIPLVKFGAPGTDELYQSLDEYIHDYDALLLAHHGVLTIGADIFNAYYKMETVEHFAQIAFIARQLGQTHTLNAEQVKKITDLREKFNIQTSAGCVVSESESKFTPNKQDISERPNHRFNRDEYNEIINEITEIIISKINAKDNST
jgi:L-fuculose-phosphate aldolase